jgi:multidrug resistance efflux pump
MSKEREKYQIRSEDVQELLGHVPRWIIRWGTIVVFCVVVVLVLLAKVLRYPDIINSQIQLTANIYPAELKAYTDGTISNILVNDKQIIEKGELLAVIQSSANYVDVIWLANTISNSFSIKELLEKDISVNPLKLGSLHSTYASFINEHEDYKSFVDVEYYQRKSNSLEQELLKYQEYTLSIIEQRDVLRKEYGIVVSQFKRDSLLTVEGVLSKSDLELSEEKKLSKLLELKQLNSTISQTSLETTNLKQEKLELELRLEQQNQKLYGSLKAKWEGLKGAIAVWQKLYLVESPINGKASFSKIWSENQYVKEGEIVITVLPQSYEYIVGRVNLKPSGAGKIKSGNKVIIRFHNYPYLEYGVVTGEISSMSLTPENGDYYASVLLDSTELITSYNIKINFNQNMQGNAEIITESRSLLERILAPMKSAIEIQKMYIQSEN